MKQGNTLRPLCCAVFFVFYLFSCPLFGRDFYISSSKGSETNDGLTENTPLLRIPKEIKNNDRILLKAGDVFYSQLSLSKNIVTRYGEGSNPILSGYKRILTPRWERVSGNIWRICLSNDNYSGFITGSSLLNNIGSLHEYDKDILHGRKVRYKKELVRDWDIWQSENFSSKAPTSEYDSLYLFLKQDPNKLKIEFSIGGTAVRMFASTLDHINIEGFGFGISAFSNCHINECKVDAIGGMVQLGQSDFVCFGNGIEFYISGIVENSLVENCYIRRCYDCGCSIQGSGHKGAYPKNIVFRNNMIEKCCYGWEDFLNNGDGCNYVNCSFEKNIVVYGDSEFGYSSTAVRYCHILGNNCTGNRGMIIKGNTFIGGNLYRSGAYKNEYKSNIWINNLYYSTYGRYLLCNYMGTKDHLVVKNFETLKNSIYGYRNLTGDKSTKIKIMSQSALSRKESKTIRAYLKKHSY